MRNDFIIDSHWTWTKLFLGLAYILFSVIIKLKSMNGITFTFIWISKFLSYDIKINK